MSPATSDSYSSIVAAWATRRARARGQRRTSDRRAAPAGAPEIDVEPHQAADRLASCSGSRWISCCAQRIAGSPRRLAHSHRSDSCSSMRTCAWRNRSRSGSDPILVAARGAGHRSTTRPPAPAPPGRDRGRLGGGLVEVDHVDAGRRVETPSHGGAVGAQERVRLGQRAAQVVEGLSQIGLRLALGRVRPEQEGDTVAGGRRLPMQDQERQQREQSPRGETASSDRPSISTCGWPSSRTSSSTTTNDARTPNERGPNTGSVAIHGDGAPTRSEDGPGRGVSGGRRWIHGRRVRRRRVRSRRQMVDGGLIADTAAPKC